MNEFDETLNHYRRMIEWARFQGMDESPSSIKMQASIGEDWTQAHCAMCNAHYHVTDENTCITCPIYKYELERCGIVGTRWHRLNKSKTWPEWILNAEYFCAMVELIR